MKRFVELIFTKQVLVDLSLYEKIEKFNSRHKPLCKARWDNLDLIHICFFSMKVYGDFCFMFPELMTTEDYAGEVIKNSAWLNKLVDEVMGLFYRKT